MNEHGIEQSWLVMMFRGYVQATNIFFLRGFGSSGRTVGWYRWPSTFSTLDIWEPPLQHVRNLRIRATFVVFNVRKPFCDFYVWYVIIMLSLHLQNRKSSFRQYKTPQLRVVTGPIIAQLPPCFEVGHCSWSFAQPSVVRGRIWGLKSYSHPFRDPGQHETTWRDVTSHTQIYIYIYIYIYTYYRFTLPYVIIWMCTLLMFSLFPYIYIFIILYTYFAVYINAYIGIHTYAFIFVICVCVVIFCYNYYS